MFFTITQGELVVIVPKKSYARSSGRIISSLRNVRNVNLTSYATYVVFLTH